MPSKPARKAISHGLEGWDSAVNDNFVSLIDRPRPTASFADLATLSSSYPAEQHLECVALVVESGQPIKMYVSDGSNWLLLAATP